MGLCRNGGKEKMKYTIRRQFWNILIYGFITTTQKQTGIMSIIPETEYHYVLMDMDNQDYSTVIQNLNPIIAQYNLENVVLMSDKEDSYRIFSPTPVTYKTLLQILLNTKGVDYLFFKWTVRRGYATIRLSNKKGRNAVKIINILNHDGKYKPDIDGFKFVEYETDLG